MEIRDIQIKTVYTGAGCGDSENLRHEKICRELSIVQALEGYYEFALGGDELVSTGENGVFIAPSNKLQTIIHHNGKSGIMRAHWIFIDAVVNGQYRFDELFSFPVILDKKYDGEVCRLIQTVANTDNYFEKIRAIYTLLEILMKESNRKKKPSPIKTAIEAFVGARYQENITAKEIAEHLNYSQAQVYKLVKKYFALTPANYINCVRLQRAEALLALGENTITEIAFQVGFQDGAYFSRLFKAHYGESPKHYRKRRGE